MRRFTMAAAAAAALTMTGPAAAAVTVQMSGTLDTKVVDGALGSQVDADFAHDVPMAWTLSMTFEDPGQQGIWDASAWAFTLGDLSFDSTTTTASSANVYNISIQTSYFIALRGDFAPSLPGDELLYLSTNFLRLPTGGPRSPSTDPADYFAARTQDAGARVSSSSLSGPSGGYVDFRGSITSISFDGAFLPNQGVPEPSTWALMILGFGAAGAMLRRRPARA
ncbi:PEPxxWA-CTERM sorting domain-containing protein [Phenylobacterium sp.]|uniref:PEPxxWA-CTERM sorting domain-containing protein n=1 Tax=Phenylobacterium sp. TaxID=1871053 RepID=UPI0025F95D01|nr:PEPxxWA-CTERM sorting domain-containing protein [Phenylobacterium sp.]MBX3485689.1 PEP-CTERM sorting domain-containing protein [Phenylobacterium sp.]